MKMNFRNNWFNAAVLVVTVSVAMTACQKKYTDPPILGNPDIVANITIKDVKARYTSGAPVKINDDVVIEGIVGADDRSGNYYQQIAIQDATGGVLLRLAGNNLYNNYPVGRKLFVKLKGLYLGQYNGTLQFGGGIDSPYINQGGVTLLAYNLIDQHIIKGALNQPLVPKVVTVADLTTSLQNPYISTLVKLQGFQFKSNELGKNYADDGQSGNRIIENCATPAATITVRTSNYSNFARLPVAQGNGDIIGIYSYFSSTKQWTIRDTTDVQFYGSRCPTGAGNGSISLTASPQTINFDNIGTSGLPQGVYVKENATSLDLGVEASVPVNHFNTQTQWSSTTGAFKNFASATGLASNASTATQNASTNRALGIRQTGSYGDPGAAFAFQLANTTGKSNLALEFKLQSLDITAAGRTTTWRVDYGTGLSPSSFTTIATAPVTLTTAYGTFANTTVTVNFGAALNNISGPIWIRIVTLSAATGSSNRASTGIDDVKFTWN
ncbi:MAG: hypothetical protein HOP10_06990 [Chitinophagaceae bacterium]|nr:hypothetical protein [Chitinophagaceae bacterium]